MKEFLLGALSDATGYRKGGRAFCPDCRTSPDGLCRYHEEDAYLAERYAQAHARLLEATSGDPALADSRAVAALLDMIEGRAVLTRTPMHAHTVPLRATTRSSPGPR